MGSFWTLLTEVSDPAEACVPCSTEEAFFLLGPFCLHTLGEAGVWRQLLLVVGSPQIQGHPASPTLAAIG